MLEMFYFPHPKLEYKSDICLSCDVLVLHVTLLQNGVHHIKVHCRYVDVHIFSDGHQLRAFRPPEVDL